MPNFSARSSARLETCDPRLVQLFEMVVAYYDCSIEGGARTPAEQVENVAHGVSKKLDSKHVVDHLHPLSRAVDAAPYPVKWPYPGSSTYIKDIARFYHFAGYVKKCAEVLGIKIRWGGDWDADLDFADQTFDDLDHFELIEA